MVGLRRLLDPHRLHDAAVVEQDSALLTMSAAASDHAPTMSVAENRSNFEKNPPPIGRPARRTGTPSSPRGDRRFLAEAVVVLERRPTPQFSTRR